MSITLRTAAFAATLFVAGLAYATSPVFALTYGGAPEDASKPGLAALTAPPVDLVPASSVAQTAPSPPAASDEPVAGDAASGNRAADLPGYASLAAAVAAQPMPETMASELRCLASAIYFEAKGEPLAGQLAVGNVIINRANSGRFRSGICAVVLQPGQFSFVRDGHIPAINGASRAFRDAVAVAQLAMSNGWNSQAPDALFFHARHVSPGWRQARVAAIGNHIFYR